MKSVEGWKRASALSLNYRRKARLEPVRGFPSCYPISRIMGYFEDMTFTDTHSTVRPTVTATSAQAPTESQRTRWVGGKLPSEREREIIEARRARKRAA